MTTTDDKIKETATDIPTEGTGTHPPDASNVTVTDPPEASDTQGDNTTEPPEASDTTTEPPADGDTFDRAYVEGLRSESAGYRTQLRTVQEQLHRTLVEKSGALADPADLPFDAAHLEDPEALQAAIDALVANKPHLKARKFAPGGAGQGAKGGAASGGVDLLGMLRANA